MGGLQGRPLSFFSAILFIHSHFQGGSMCGIFGIANHVEAVPMSYLGLYALQHRGQESCGISSSDGTGVYTQKGRGFVRDFFSESVIGKLKGYSAIGHDRYSTAGDKEDGAEKNAQPIVVKCKFGTISLAHNGKLNNPQSDRPVRKRQYYRSNQRCPSQNQGSLLTLDFDGEIADRGSRSIGNPPLGDRSVERFLCIFFGDVRV